LAIAYFKIDHGRLFYLFFIFFYHLFLCRLYLFRGSLTFNKRINVSDHTLTLCITKASKITIKQVFFVIAKKLNVSIPVQIYEQNE
jgi:hypothetical protein